MQAKNAGFLKTCGIPGKIFSNYSQFCAEFDFYGILLRTFAS